MPEPTTLSVPIGCDASWQLDAANTDTEPVAFEEGDTPEAVVWQGADSPALFTPSATWIDPAAGTILLSVSGASTAALKPGLFPVELSIVTATNLRYRALEAWLELTASPGTAQLPPTYGDYQDLVDFGGGEWIETVRRKTGLSNFVRERSRARMYLDDLIVAKFRPWAFRTRAWTGLLAAPPDARNPTLRDYLAADYKPDVVLLNGATLAPGQTVLVVTDDVREIVALKALELVARSRVALDDEKGLNERKMNQFRGLCRNKVLCYRAELDLDQDGLVDLAFHLGNINTR